MRHYFVLTGKQFWFSQIFFYQNRNFQHFLFFSTNTLNEPDAEPSVTKPITTLILSDIWGICVAGTRERLTSTPIISFNHSRLGFTFVREEAHVSPNTTVYSLLHSEYHFVLAGTTVTKWRGFLTIGGHKTQRNMLAHMQCSMLKIQNFHEVLEKSMSQNKNKTEIKLLQW